MRKYYNSNKSSILKQQKQYRKSARGKLVLKARYEAIKMGKGSTSGGKKDKEGGSSRKKLNAANKALAVDNVKTMKEAAKVDKKKKSNAGKGKGRGIRLNPNIPTS